MNGQTCINPDCGNESADGSGEVWCQSCHDYYHNKFNIMQGIVEGELREAYEYICDNCGLGFIIVKDGQGPATPHVCPECDGDRVLFAEIDETPMRLHPVNQRRNA